jgi:hypothetical protein
MKQPLSIVRILALSLVVVITASGALYGTDRSGGYVVAVERAPGDSSTLWAATQPGRVFISKNVDAEPASAVTFRRLDSLAANDPNRFVNGFGVFRRPSGATGWTPAAPGMPNVEVAGLTIVVAERRLLAATHGLGAWLLNLK